MWGDRKFRELTQDAKFLWLYLLTGPQTTSLPGLIRVGRAAMADDLDRTTNDIETAFAELVDKGMARGDLAARFVWLPTAAKHNQPANPNIVVNWRREFDALPECNLKAEAHEAVIDFLGTLDVVNPDDFVAAFMTGRKPRKGDMENRFRNGFANGMRNQEQEQEQNKKLLSPGGDGREREGEGGRIAQTERIDHQAEPIPYQYIVAEYHKALPMLPAVRILTPTRKKKISARWHESPKRQTVEFWAQYFGYAAKSDFLTGRNGAWTACDFEWLVELSNFAKVVEGKYANKGGV